MPFEARSSPAGYIVLAGIYLVMGTSFAVIEYLKSDGKWWQASAICYAVALLWITWLKGFRLRVIGEEFEYRNGLYQTKRAAICDVLSVRSRWVRWKVLWRQIEVPRLLIELRDEAPIVINIKPFSRSDIATVRAMFNEQTS